MNLIPVPLDGDPQSLATWAAKYKQTAQNLKKAADDLRDLTDDESFVSLAVDEIRIKALEARTSTESIYVRYDGAADAFAKYAHELADAQARANRAIAAFHDADGPGRRAQAERDDLEEQTKTDGGQTPDLLQQFLDAKRRAESYLSHAASALAEYNAAVQDKHDAVERAKHSLDKAADKSDLNDGFFDAIAGAFQAAYEWAQENLAPLIAKLHDVLKVISDILSVISLIVTVLAIFIPVLAPLAAALKVVSLVVSGLVLLCSIALFALGKGSLGQLLGDTISFAANAFMFKAGDAIGAGVTSGLARAGGMTTSAAESFASRGALVLVQAHSVEMKVTEAVAETTVDLVADHVTEQLASAGEAIGGEGTIDLAPSAAGPSWNAPPTIQVPPVFEGSAGVENVVASEVGSNVGGGITVCATAGA